jgi:hypothetical protein
MSKVHDMEVQASASKMCENSGIAPHRCSFAASEKSETIVEGDELRGDNRFRLQGRCPVLRIEKAS